MSVTVRRRVRGFHEVLQRSVKAIDRSVVVHRGVKGLHKGSRRGRGIRGGCSRNRGSRFRGG